MENHCLPDDLGAAINRFAEWYNPRRHRGSLNNFASIDIYFGCKQTFLLERERIKHQTMQTRRLIHQQDNF